MTTLPRLDQSRVHLQQTQQLQRASRVEAQVQPRQALGDGFEAPRRSWVGAEVQRKKKDTEHPLLDSIANADLVSGKRKSCVTTVRANLQALGLEGLPPSTGEDKNNARGMMVQMLESGHWDSLHISGAERRTIESPYGTVEASVLTREQYDQAVADGTIPDGAVVFQTKHGWDYGEGPYGNDVGILQDGRIFNSSQMRSAVAYGDASKDFVVLLPRE